MPERSLTAVLILYWVLRGFTLLIGLLLGFGIVAAYAWIPFYASEGYSPRFEDRLLGLVGDFLLFIAIIILHRRSLRRLSLLSRIALLGFAISWKIVVDVIAFNRGLTLTRFTAASGMALVVGTLLLATLRIQFAGRRTTSA
ncbi:MAG TPA: hypothetical protein VGC73_08955 [Pyrinomonadaceae bacterium]